MSGGFNPISIISQVALAAVTGGTSLIATMAMQIAEQVAKQVIQQIGTQLGLPQSAISAATTAFDAATGNVGGAAQDFAGVIQNAATQVHASTTQAGDLQRAASSAVNSLVSHLGDSQDVKAAKSSGGAAAGGWLMQLAQVLGSKLNEMAKNMNDLAGQITKDTPDMTAKFGAATQEFGILMNATNNAIKTLGEGLTTTARKG